MQHHHRDRTVYDDRIVTVIYPGFGASRSQMAKYTGSDGVVVLGNDHDRRYMREQCGGVDPNCCATARGVADALISDADRERFGILYHATCSKAPLLLYNVLPSPEVHELMTRRWSWNPAHWITMLKSVAVSWYFGIDGTPTSYMLLSHVNMAGHVDQAACLAEIERAVRLLLQQKNGDGDDDDNNSESRSSRRRLVLFGCSRGASTMLFTALRLPQALAVHVGLVVLEAPFNTLEDVVRESSWCPAAAMAAFKALGNYEGEEPYRLPVNTHLACPVAFVTSVKDRRVPEACTLRAMERVRDAFPHLRVAHLRLQHSPHASMSVYHRDDVAAYDAFLHRLYQQHVTLHQDDVDPMPSLS